MLEQASGIPREMIRENGYRSIPVEVGDAPCQHVLPTALFRDTPPR
jgi:hypothetical protein